MQRELLYECSSDSGRAMESSAGCNNAEDVGQRGLALTQGPMLDDQGNNK